MVTFDTFEKRFSGLKKFLLKRGQEILISRQAEVVKMVREQHHAGVNKLGKQMQSGYSAGYGKRRKKKGLQTKFVDLHFSGKYHKGLKLEPAFHSSHIKKGIDVTGDTDYEKYLRGNFPNMAGLTKEHADEVAEILAKLIAPEIEKYLVG